MTSNTLTPRVALGELNANTHATISPANTLKQSDKSVVTSTIEKCSQDKNLSPSKSRKLSTTPSRQSPKKERVTRVFEDAQVAGTKRRFEDIDENNKSQESQRPSLSAQLKKEGSTLDGATSLPLLTENTFIEATDVEELLQDVSPTREVEEFYLSGTASPASSFRSEDLSALNDSQNTIITEPDSPVSQLMSREELRQVRCPPSSGFPYPAPKHSPYPDNPF